MSTNRFPRLKVSDAKRLEGETERGKVMSTRCYGGRKKQSPSVYVCERGPISAVQQTFERSRVVSVALLSRNAGDKYGNMHLKYQKNACGGYENVETVICVVVYLQITANGRIWLGNYTGGKLRQRRQR